MRIIISLICNVQQIKSRKKYKYWVIIFWATLHVYTLCLKSLDKCNATKKQVAYKLSPVVSAIAMSFISINDTDLINGKKGRVLPLKKPDAKNLHLLCLTDSTLRKLYFHFLSNWMGYYRDDSFPFDFLNQMEIHLVQNRKENCHHDHILFNLKGNGNIIFSV